MTENGNLANIKSPIHYAWYVTEIMAILNQMVIGVWQGKNILLTIFTKNFKRMLNGKNKRIISYVFKQMLLLAS